MMTSNWMVVLEVVRRPGALPVDADVLRRVLALLCEGGPDGAQPIALLTDDRYALHLRVTACHVSEAIVVGVRRWERVSTRLGLHGWDARRAEVMTTAEFEAEAEPLAGSAWRPGDR